MVESVIFTLTPLSHAAVEQNKARHVNSVVAGTLAKEGGVEQNAKGRCWSPATE